MSGPSPFQRVQLAPPEPRCPYSDCGSKDVIDCGEVFDGVHHFECNGCQRGFSSAPSPS